jgi:hypothetical protein
MRMLYPRFLFLLEYDIRNGPGIVDAISSKHLSLQHENTIHRDIEIPL